MRAIAKTFLVLLALAPLILQPSTCLAQGTSFTYQGRFTDNGAPYTGNAEIQATLWNAVSGGSQIAANVPAQVVVAVTNGLFVLPLNFGANFPGANRWLQLEVRTSIGAFTPLTPRQPLAPTPYAITAGNLTGPLPAAQLSGTVASANLAGTYSSALTLSNAANSFSGSGAALTALNAGQLTSGTVPDARLGANVARTNQVWLLGGNPGTTPGTHFLGTTDTSALEFKVNGRRALRIEHATNSFYGYSPNIVGGYSGNIISNGFVGGVIGGGGYSGDLNRVGNDFATVVGGARNTASGLVSTAMGYDTRARGSFSTAMGNNTTASGGISTAMGYFTEASGDYSTAMGFSAKANHAGAFVWADSQGNNFASTGINQFCIRANGGVQLNGDTPMFFGSTLSQKIHLYGTTFAIGIQNSVQYSRVGVGGGFGWYAGGGHNDNTFNSGGGTTLMTLTTGGLAVNGLFVHASDRNLKENFAPVQPREMLAKVLALPLSSWNLKADPATRHVGPMAQDFYAAFNLGADDKHIATVDADGVALAAIQGLNERLEAGGQRSEVRSQRSEVRIQKLEAENAELKQRLEALEKIIRSQSSN